MPDRLARSTSIYLDLLRVLAALTVLLSHASWHKLSGGFLWPLEHYGHSAVVVFFVLSGFVIAYTAETKDHTLDDYALSRFARLYSVILPALILTVVADAIGRSINPAPYMAADETHPLYRVVMATLFLSETWHHDIVTMSDQSYWSMPYEFWYYVIFAAVFYLRGARRVFAAAGAALIAGPNILLMFPIWLMGVAAYRLKDHFSFRRLTASLLFAGSLGAIAVAEYLLDGRGLLLRHFTASYPPGFSPYDYALGAMVSANVLAANFLPLSFGPLAGPIRRSASYTFSIYLYHLPILHLLAALLPPDTTPVVRWFSMMGCTSAAVVLLGRFTEHRKDIAKSLLQTALRRSIAIRTALRYATSRPRQALFRRSSS